MFKAELSRQKLPAILYKHGYELHTTQTAMYMPLGCAVELKHPTQIGTIALKDLENWSAATAPSLGKDSEIAGFCRLLEQEECRFLAWREREKIIAGLLLVCRGTHAGIHEVATLEQCRSKGIVSSLMRYAFETALQKAVKMYLCRHQKWVRPFINALG